MEIKSNQKKFVLYGWLILTLFYLCLRYQNLPGVFSKAGFMVPDTDPYYRLHRIESIVNGSWSYPLFDNKIEYPKGYNVAWPLGMDYIIAAPLKIFGVHDRMTILSFAFLIIPILTLPILFLTGAVTTRLSTPILGLASGLFVTLMPMLLYQTGVGRVDHHSLEALFIILNLWLLLKSQSNNCWVDIAMIASLGLAPSIYPHGWVPAGLVCFALTIEKNADLLKHFSKIFYVSFLVSLIPLSFTDRFISGYISMPGFSWWASLCLLTGCFYLYLLSALRTRKFHLFQKLPLVYVLSMIVVGTFFAIKSGLGIFTGEVKGISNFLMAKGGVLGQTVESKSPFSFSFKDLKDVNLIFLMPFVYLWFLIKRKQLTLLLYSFPVMAILCFQIRFMTLASPLIAVLIVLWFYELWSRVQIKSNFQYALVFISVLAVSMIYMPKMGFTRIGSHSHYFQPVRAASIFLKNEVEKNHFDPNQSAVISEWDYGHWILYYSKLPVIASPFQGGHALLTENLFLSETAKELNDYEQTTRPKYLILEQDLPRYISTIEYIGQDPFNYFSFERTQTQKQTIRPKPKFQKTFYHRMLNAMGTDERGDFPDQWRLIYVSSAASQDSPFLPALKVFEKVPGALIQIRSKSDQLWIQTEVQDKNTQYKLRKLSTKVDGDIHQWRVPYAYYERENVLSSGIYKIMDPKGKVIAMTPQVLENQVQEGQRIILK